jgi:AmmeMemoRadiSam system protein B
MRVRQAAVAGRFYPEDPLRLAAMVDGFLDAARPSDGPVPHAIIAPHAGFIYSGATAGVAFAAWRQAMQRCRRVVVLGPSHYLPLDGMAMPSADAFATPLGSIEVDTEAVAELGRLPGLIVDDEAHGPEHAIETHLPFLQRLGTGVRLVPLLVGDSDPAAVARVLAMLDDGATLISVSSDLSHFLDQPTARRVDRLTADHIEALDVPALRGEHACGFHAIRGLMHHARQRGWTAVTRSLTDSGLTSGDRARVVGYGAFHFV